MEKITLFSQMPKPKSMVKELTLTIIVVMTSLSSLFSTSPLKSSYHSLYLFPSLSSNSTIASYLYNLILRPHVVGTKANADTATYVLSTLTSYNITSHLTPYDVLLAYPLNRSLTLQRSSTDPPIPFNLTQQVYEGDPYANVSDQLLPTSQGYAKSDVVVGAVAYVNYGQVEDYERLEEMRVNITGAIVLAKYGKIFRGDIVQNAYNRGAIRAVIYTDRKDYGGGCGDAQ
ncbi:hypothetical protein Ancab_028540 [Ancistrocladus abbreviatus]